MLFNVQIKDNISDIRFLVDSEDEDTIVDDIEVVLTFVVQAHNLTVDKNTYVNYFPKNNDSPWGNHTFKVRNLFVLQVMAEIGMYERMTGQADELVRLSTTKLVAKNNNH